MKVYFYFINARAILTAVHSRTLEGDAIEYSFNRCSDQLSQYGLVN